MVEKGMMGEIYWMGWKQKTGQVQAGKALQDTQEEEKKQPPTQAKSSAQANAPPVKQPRVVLPPKPLSVLNPEGKWTPKFCQPVSFGKLREKLSDKFPNLEELHRLKGPPKLTEIKY